MAFCCCRIDALKAAIACKYACQINHKPAVSDIGDDERSANLCIKKVEHPNWQYPVIALVALRDIAAGEELSWAYGWFGINVLVLCSDVMLLIVFL